MGTQLQALGNNSMTSQMHGAPVGRPFPWAPPQQLQPPNPFNPGGPDTQPNTRPGLNPPYPNFGAPDTQPGSRGGLNPGYPNFGGPDSQPDTRNQLLAKLLGNMPNGGNPQHEAPAFPQPQQPPQQMVAPYTPPASPAQGNMLRMAARSPFQGGKLE